MAGVGGEITVSARDEPLGPSVPIMQRRALMGQMVYSGPVCSSRSPESGEDQQRSSTPVYKYGASDKDPVGIGPVLP